MRANLLIIILALTACSQEDTYTWGQVSEDLAAVYCETVAECSPGDVAECIRHNVHHMCELEQTCGDSVSDARRSALDICIADIPNQDCNLLGWGILPVSCAAIWE